MNNFLLVCSLLSVPAHLFLILYGPNQKLDQKSGDEKKDKHTTFLVMTCIFSLTIAVHIIGVLLRFSLWTNPPAFLSWGYFGDRGWAYPVGAALFIFGFWLRIIAIYTLGKFFTFQIGIRANEHRVISHGVYAFFRHPGYAGYIYAVLGIHIAHGFLFGILFSIFMILIVYGFRIPAEEKMLTEYFGDEYRAYSKKTKRFIPFIF